MSHERGALRWEEIAGRVRLLSGFARRGLGGLVGPTCERCSTSAYGRLSSHDRQADVCRQAVATSGSRPMRNRSVAATWEPRHIEGVRRARRHGARRRLPAIGAGRHSAPAAQHRRRCASPAGPAPPIRRDGIRARARQQKHALVAPCCRRLSLAFQQARAVVAAQSRHEHQEGVAVPSPTRSLHARLHVEHHSDRPPCIRRRPIRPRATACRLSVSKSRSSERRHSWRDRSSQTRITRCVRSKIRLLQSTKLLPCFIVQCAPSSAARGWLLARQPDQLHFTASLLRASLHRHNARIHHSPTCSMLPTSREAEMKITGQSPSGTYAKLLVYIVIARHDPAIAVLAAHADRHGSVGQTRA